MLDLHKNICCDPSSELSHQDHSDEGSQHVVLVRNKKNYHQILLSSALRHICTSSDICRLRHSDLIVRGLFLHKKYIPNEKTQHQRFSFMVVKKKKEENLS